MEVEYILKNKQKPDLELENILEKFYSKQKEV